MRVTLQEMRRMELFEEIDPPEIVYHMTNRKNIDHILHDGKIKAGHDGNTDFVTWFFPALEEIPVYIELTWANTGRKYYDFDVRIHEEPPLNHAGTVVLKLRPRGRQDMEWYRELPAKGRNMSSLSKDKLERLLTYFSAARICHYEAMVFESNPEIIELTEVDKLPASEKLRDIWRIKGKEAGK